MDGQAIARTSTTLSRRWERTAALNPPRSSRFGESDKFTGGDYSADGQVRSVLGLLDELEIEYAVLCGYDVGSRVAQLLATRHPERVVRSLAEKAPERRIVAPTRVLWPEHDPLFPRAWADRAGEWFADAEVSDLPGVGHFVPVEAPEAFAGAIRRALAR